MTAENNKEMELYIHIPFCLRKCNYCDFLSFAGGITEEIKENYIKALINEIKAYSALYNQMPVSSIFIGGGTPSAIKPWLIKEIMEVLRGCFDILPAAEISMEANPGSLNEEKLGIYRECGINRLSLGLQATHEEELKRLGRIHSYEAFEDNYHKAVKAGFNNINVDLMSAIPGQTLKDWTENLDRVIALRPQHISAYSLIIEEGTPFADTYGEGKPLFSELPDEETEREMYYETRRRLGAAGFFQYELSNYALPGFECRHNIGYWTRKNYLGFGLGAASLMENERWSNTRDLKEYISGKNAPIREKLSIEEAMSEFMFLGLRLTKGISLKAFKETFGAEAADYYGVHIEKMLREGLLELNEDKLRLTYRGMDLANYVMCGFV